MNTFCLSSVTADAFARRRLKILLGEGAAVSSDRNESVYSQGNVIKQISQSVFRILFFFSPTVRRRCASGGVFLVVMLQRVS